MIEVAHHSRRHPLTSAWFWAGVLAAAVAIVGLSQSEGRAADCCKVTYSADHKTMTVTGYVDYRGELITVSVGDQRCLSQAGPGRAYMKATFQTRYMPNGEYRIGIVQKVRGNIVTSSETFRITDSPAVAVDITSPKAKIVQTDSPVLKYKTKGSVTKTSCTVDGKPVDCGATSASLSGLAEGKHVFSTKVEGKLGFTDGDRKEFKVDTAPPTPPVVSGGGEEPVDHVVHLRASGSRDPGSGVARYEFQVSTDSGTTWGGTIRGDEFYVSDPGVTLVRFRAVDGLGRVSGWTVATANIDYDVGQVSIVQSNGTSPCDVTFPLTLTASGGTNVDHYEWAYALEGYADSTYVGDALVLTEPGRYTVSVTAIETGGDFGSLAYWNSTSC